MALFLRRFALCVLLLPALALAACHDHDDYDDDPPRKIVVPSGGRAFGVFNHFEHDFAQRDISGTFDQDGFTFSLAENSAVLITLTCAAGFNGFVDLYDGDFDFIAGDDHGGPGLDAVLVVELLAGDYIIIVGGIGSSKGDYDVDILVGTLGGLDMGVLESGDLVVDEEGSLADAEDTDCFFFTLLDDEVVNIYLTKLNGNYDGNLQLIDQFGQEVIWVDPAGDSNPAILSLALEPGSYMLVVGCSSGSGDYELAVDVE